MAPLPNEFQVTLTNRVKGEVDLSSTDLTFPPLAPPDAAGWNLTHAVMGEHKIYHYWEKNIPQRQVSFSDSGNLDAFGRLRVSEPFTLFESQLTAGKATHLWDERITGTGASSTHLPNEAAVRLRVGTAAGEKVVRQSRQYIRYQPGKSQEILLTGVIGAAKAGVRKRIGYFDDNNGLFFQVDASGIAVVRRSKASGTVVDTVASQADWNLDRLDGTGSGYTLDLTKTQIFFIDFEWLGVGRVRLGLVLDGQVIYVHEFNHANNLTQVYMSSPHLPVRYEIENLAATASTTDLMQICSTVIAEGGYSERGLVRQGGNRTLAKTVSTTLVPLASFRLKAAMNRATVWPLSFDILNTANSYVHYQIIMRGTLTGATWVGESDAVEIDTAATAVSGGMVIGGGYVSKDLRVTSNDLDISVPLCADIDGTADILTIAAVSLSGSSTMYSGMTWKELF